ncbi:ABC transporter ATP-binding protein [Aldersonia sp. NBC_00410]|uniref:ABC transporter ATP-binding protein n=1 Tax=Aldersonia sp. NBC_00410 TaxID=2975954 RepID=UPI0022527213|nr:ABC transporter ATP-binding protein [Aldersonia sp. NBC_00410]MCX5042034.1 ABC transporter ATP-binding protein [Aldersonia sp. NBC_00410]
MTTAAGSPVVDVESLTRTFGERRGIAEVSFNIAEGEIFGFLGPNGAGKSTTIRLLLGLYRPTSGTMRVLGHDPTRDRTEMLRRIGYLPGEVKLFTRLTGRQHLDRVAHIRGVTDLRLRDELVERLGAELDTPLRTLSKGNRQKLGLVMAFMHRPDLLVLDEPTSGLDPLLQEEFAHLVGEVAGEGRTVFLSSHELDEVQRLAHRVAIIKEGSLVVTDTVENLRRAAPRTIEFAFDGPIDPDRFAAIDGVTVRGYSDDLLTLSVTGAIAAVLRAAADLDPIDINARRADLDELFLAYYREAPDAN